MRLIITLFLLVLFAGSANAQAPCVANLLSAAEGGDVEAQNGLGRCYELGQDVPKNYAEAYFWYSLAASKVPVADRYNVTALRDGVAEHLTKTQIEVAKKNVAEWIPATATASPVEIESRTLARIPRPSVFEMVTSRAFIIFFILPVLLLAIAIPALFILLRKIFKVINWRSRKVWAVGALLFALWLPWEILTANGVCVSKFRSLSDVDFVDRYLIGPQALEMTLDERSAKRQENLKKMGYTVVWYWIQGPYHYLFTPYRVNLDIVLDNPDKQDALNVNIGLDSCGEPFDRWGDRMTWTGSDYKSHSWDRDLTKYYKNLKQ